MPAIADRLTTSEAARAAGVSSETIRSWLRGGRLAHEPTALGALIDAASLGRLIGAREARARARARSTKGEQS